MDANIIATLAQQAPIPTILFLAFFIYHRSESKKWQQVTNEQSRNNERMFNLFQQEIQVISKLASAIERVDTKVTIGWSCPMLQRNPDDLKKALKDMDNGQTGLR